MILFGLQCLQRWFLGCGLSLRRVGCGDDDRDYGCY